MKESFTFEDSQTFNAKTQSQDGVDIQIKNKLITNIIVRTFGTLRRIRVVI